MPNPDQHSLSLRDLLLEEMTLLASIVEKEGEILPEIENALKANQYDLKNKVDGYYRVMKRLELEVAFRSNQARQQKEIAERCEAVFEKMKDSIKDALVRNQKKEIRGLEWRFMLTGSRPKIELRPEKSLADVPGHFKTIKTVETLNKDSILKRHESVQRGGETDAAIPITDLFNIEPCYSLRSYPNTKTRKELTNGGPSLSHHIPDPADQAD